jgi:site-specific recombinase XerC
MLGCCGRRNEKRSDEGRCHHRPVVTLTHSAWLVIRSLPVSGVDIVTVAELIGHASLETTRLYTRPSAANMQRAVDLLATDE